MIIYISTLKCRFDLYAPFFARIPFFPRLKLGENTFFVWCPFIAKSTPLIFIAFMTMTEQSSRTMYEKLIKLMIYHITISIYVILLIHLTKKNGIFCLHVYYLASNIILTNIPLPVLSIISVLWCIYLDRGYIFKDIDFKFNMIDISKKLRLQGKRKLNSTCRRLFFNQSMKG